MAVKIISGDNRLIARQVAESVGIDVERVITGAEIGQMRDEALINLAPRVSLFAEVDPNQKERIIRALQKTGHVVGFLGDGINDAPALHAADVGISVDNAVDVARRRPISSCCATSWAWSVRASTKAGVPSPTR